MKKPKPMERGWLLRRELEKLNRELLVSEQRGYKKGWDAAMKICSQHARFMQDKIVLIKTMATCIESIEKWTPLEQELSRINNEGK